MPRQSQQNWDYSRTKLLNQDELLVKENSGSDHYFYVRNQEPGVACCPRCSHTELKNQGLFSKTYSDVIPEGTVDQPVTLEYEFYKYRCLNCGHVFSRKIKFAAPDDAVTYRLEDEVARQVIEGNSYADIANSWGQLTRQAVGQIFNRWVHRKEEGRRIRRPSSKIGIVSGKLGRDRLYTLFLNLDESGNIRIYDALFGVSSLDIGAALDRIGRDKIRMVLSDCNPTIVSVIRDQLPGAVHVIPVDYWFDLVSRDFEEFAQKEMKWSSVPKKEELIMMPPSGIIYGKRNLDRLLDDRPRLRKPYEAFNRLRSILSNRDEMWIFNELLEWVESLDAQSGETLKATILQLNEYRPQIENQLQYLADIPEGLFRLTDDLERMLSGRKLRTFSEEVLKARLLYSVKTDLQDWQGVPVGIVTRRLGCR